MSNWGRFQNWKGPGTQPQSSKILKRLIRIIAIAYIYQLVKLSDFMSYGSKYLSCTNTHRDVTDLVNHGMVKIEKLE